MQVDQATIITASLLIPTYNAGSVWKDVLESIALQDFKFTRKLIIDSGSKDNTVKLAREYGFDVITIPKEEFNHGATRQMLANNAGGAEIGVYLTQDAILNHSQSVKHLVNAFYNKQVALAYGRQLPHINATALETHARLFNYPTSSAIRSYQDKERMGFKVFFCSNSFAAYRLKTLNENGGFPSASIMGEDAIVSAGLLKKGYKLAYTAEATVRHSHSYTCAEEFRRYFDTRVFHEQNPWMITEFGKPTGEGLRYAKSELSYLLKNNLFSFPKFVGSVFAKFSGYALGKYYRRMPKKLLQKVSMHKSYWLT